MKDFIDETASASGTPINRANLLAMQGFVGQVTTFNADGSITETFSGDKTVTKKTTFGNNMISEVIS